MSTARGREKQTTECKSVCFRAFIRRSGGEIERGLIFPSGANNQAQSGGGVGGGITPLLMEMLKILNVILRPIY